MTTTRKGLDSSATILILSAIDLLLAALTAAFGFMLVLSSVTAEGNEGADAGQGQVASEIVLEMSYPSWAQFSCEGDRPVAHWPSTKQGWIDDTYLLPADRPRVQCTMNLQQRGTNAEANVVLGDGVSMRVLLQCNALTRDVITIDLRPGVADSQRRLLGGACDHRIAQPGDAS